ncbi:MAG: murein biosynthesis integral membrane protein MurJ [Rickettsiaceae bacterium]
MLLKSGLIVAFFTLLSRLFGLAREFFIAYTFGTTSIADCVNVAFKFPNLFRRIFGEGALSAVFIPIFSEKLVTSEQEAKKFSGEIFTLLLITLVALTLVLEIAMPYMMALIAPGFYGEKEKFELAVILCRITTPYLIFISITALFGGMLNSVKRFAAFAFVPIILNVCVIAVTHLFQHKYSAHYSIAYSLIVAGILQVAFMTYCLFKAGLSFPLTFNTRDKGVRKLIKNMGPATMSSGAQQLNLFISQSIASFLPGAISILSYADRLYQLPLALIGITFGTILLPELSKMYKKKNYSGANILQNKAIQIALTLSLPATCGLFSLSKPIIHLIYERGEFLPKDTILTAQALAAFSFGLPAFVMAKILTPIYYANLDTKTPFRITLYSLLINTVSNILLMIPFGHIGIAMGASISAWINVWLLNKNAKQYGEFVITTETKRFASKILLACLAMLAFISIATTYFKQSFYSNDFATKSGSILGTIIIAIAIFAAVSYLLKIHKVLLKKNDQNF